MSNTEMIALRHELVEFLSALEARPDIEVLRRQIGSGSESASDLSRMEALAPALANFYRVIDGIDIAWQFREAPDGEGSLYVRPVSDQLEWFGEEEHAFGDDLVAFSFDYEPMFADASEWTWYVYDPASRKSRLVFAEATCGFDDAIELASSPAEYVRRAMAHGVVTHWPSCLRGSGCAYQNRAVKRFQSTPALSTVQVAQRVQFEGLPLGVGRGEVLALHPEASPDPEASPAFVKLKFDEGTVGWVPRSRVRLHEEVDAYERLRDPVVDLPRSVREGLSEFLAELARALPDSYGRVGRPGGLMFTPGSETAAGLLSLRSMEDLGVFLIQLFQDVWSLGPKRHETYRFEGSCFSDGRTDRKYTPAGLLSTILGGVVIRAAHASAERGTPPAELFSTTTRDGLRLVKRDLEAEDKIVRATTRPPGPQGADLGMAYYLLQETESSAPFIEYTAQGPQQNKAAGLPIGDKLFT